MRKLSEEEINFFTEVIFEACPSDMGLPDSYQSCGANALKYVRIADSEKEL